MNWFWSLLEDAGRAMNKSRYERSMMDDVSIGITVFLLIVVLFGGILGSYAVYLKVKQWFKK